MNDVIELLTGSFAHLTVLDSALGLEQNVINFNMHENYTSQGRICGYEWRQISKNNFSFECITYLMFAFNEVFYCKLTTDKVSNSFTASVICLNDFYETFLKYWYKCRLQCDFMDSVSLQPSHSSSRKCVLNFHEGYCEEGSFICKIKILLAT